MSVEKLGLVEWLPVHKRSRTLYLKMRSEDTALYDIRPDDLVLVQLKSVKKKVRDGEEISSELENSRTPSSGLTTTEQHVLTFIGNGAKTALDVMEHTKLSREHNARLLKSLHEKGFLTRDATTFPYRYQVSPQKKK